MAGEGTWILALGFCLEFESTVPGFCKSIFQLTHTPALNHTHTAPSVCSWQFIRSHQANQTTLLLFPLSAYTGLNSPSLFFYSSHLVFYPSYPPTLASHKWFSCLPHTHTHTHWVFIFTCFAFFFFLYRDRKAAAAAPL